MGKEMDLSQFESVEDKNLLNEKKKKSGRPPTPDKAKLTNKIAVYLTQEEKFNLQRNASKKGLNISGLLRFKLAEDGLI